MVCFKKQLLPVLVAITGSLNAQTPNWSENVAPIIYANCAGCHVSGGIAPVSFVGYNAANTFRYSIKSAVQSRSMPPWPADAQYRRYAHEKLLSTEEIQTIVDWVDGGAPQGDPQKAPADPTPKSGTSIVSPDLSLKIPNYNVKTTTDEYRCFVLPTGLSAAKFLTEIEVVPGNYSVVHHVLVFHDTSNVPVQLDNNDPKPGYLGFGGTGSASSKMIGVWVPGQDPFKMPSGMGIKLEAGGNIILQVHYPGNINDVMDSTKVYLKYSSLPLREVGISPALNHLAPSLQNGPLYIPPNQVKSFTSKYTIPIDLSVFAVAPHMHLVGSSIKAYGVKSPGDTSPFVSIPAWDFHWQRTYSFRNVQKVSKGTVLHGHATYDNTSSNANNPNKPPIAVSLGEGTGDEMLLVYFWYTLYQTGDENIVIDPSVPKNITSSVIQKNASEHKAYPNPTESFFYVDGWKGDAQKLTCLLYSNNGQLIQNCEHRLHEKGLEIDMRSIPPGFYYLQVKEAGKRINAYRVIRN